ncbi:MAG: hypothetical protein KJZ79_15955 [Bryobacteraceae bacterium]|nr:hypothetical protein [Bryobacteraceae bacterium]
MRPAVGGDFPAQRRSPAQWSVGRDGVGKYLQGAMMIAVAWDREGSPQQSELHMVVSPRT